MDRARRVEVVEEDSADSAGLGPVGDEEVAVAPGFEGGVVGGSVGVAGGFEGAVEVDGVFGEEVVGGEVGAAAVRRSSKGTKDDASVTDCARARACVVDEGEREKRKGKD